MFFSSVYSILFLFFQTRSVWKVLLSILSILCETFWVSSFSFAAVYNSERLFSINDELVKRSPKKK